jgi:hypothetical protein
VNSESSVGIATGYRLDGRTSIPGRDKIFIFSIASRLALGPTQLVPGTVSSGVKQPRSEAVHSTPSSAEVKNAGAIPSLPLMPS